MTEEKWMYTPGARSTMMRLETMARSPRIVELRAGGPSNSAVAAGWICCAAGLLCAWLLPLAHTFFGVAFVLAIVAMATHQVKQGTILMVSTVVACVVCSLTWFGLVAMAAHSIASSLPRKVDLSSVLDTSPAFPTALQKVVQPGAFPSLPAAGSTPALIAASSPLTTNDIAMMLRTGYDDDEILGAIGGKQLIEPINAGRANLLRSLGAGDKLIINLRARPLYAAPANMPDTSWSVRTDASRTRPVHATPVPQAPSFVAGTSPAMSYQEKDQRIQQLNTRIDALEDEIRTIRTNPRDSRYWWNYAGYGNSYVNIERRDAFLKQLDQQREDLRREKWRLEGR